MYSWIPINRPEDFDQVAKDMSPEFAPRAVVQRLKDHLTDKVRAVLVEHPYIDKDYRSTFYGFYAKKGRQYDPFCYRLHFFGEGITLTAGLKLEHALHNLNEGYYGFMVVRPTLVNTIGRTVLSIGAVKRFSGAIIDAKFVVHLLGERLTIKGFPFMQQHTDISVCAHAACWGILRYYSGRFREYRERLLYDITKMATSGDPGGLAPSRGLKLSQAEQVFSQAGLFPDIYTKSVGESFYRLLAAYVESGFPVFGAMSKKEHAVSVIGLGNPNRAALKANKKPQFVWNATKALHVIDDNLMPYQLLTDAKTPYAFSEIDAFIVPLPEKIYLSAEAVDKHVTGLLTTAFGNVLDFSHLQSPVIRYFVTTASTFRRYLQENRSQFPEELFLALMNMVLPQFIWLVELASLTDWKQKRFNSLMVMDATASRVEQLPYFVLTDRTKALIFNRATTKTVDVIDLTKNPLQPMSEFRLNLQSRS